MVMILIEEFHQHTVYGDKPGPIIIKLFSRSTQLRMDVLLLIKNQILKNILLEVVFVMLITIVGVLTFMSRINFVLI